MNKKFVDLAHKDLKELSESLKEITSDQVLELDANRNYIKKVQIQELTFINLTKLILDTNSLTEIPPLKGIPNCRELRLASNQITHISKELENLKHLEILDLKRNQITKIENLEYISDSLTWLSLSCNNLKSLSDIPFMKKLKFFGVYGNQVEESFEFKNFPVLEKIWIVGNPIYQHKHMNPKFRIELIKSIKTLEWFDNEYIVEKRKNL